MEWQYLNNISLSNKLTTFFTTNWSPDGRLYVVTDASVHILKFDSNYKNHENTLHFIKSEIKISDYHAANETGVNIDEHLLNLTRENLYHSILDHNLTPVSKHATHMQRRAINATWALVPNTPALLVIITNSGNIEIYEQTTKTWICHVNLTEQWVKHLKKTKWKKKIDSDSDSDTLYEIHLKRVSQCLAKCFALSKVYYDEKNIPFFFIIVGYTLPYLNIWKYYFSTSKTEALLVNTINTDLNNLTSIFICSLNKTDYIVCGNLDGIVKALPIKDFPTNTLQECNEFIDIWTFKDVRVSKIINLYINDNLCLIIIKGPFVILSVLNDENKVICTKHLNVENLNITGIIPFDSNTCIISTFTGAIYQLKINCENFNLNLIPIKTDLKWDFHASYGLIQSPGEILWGVVTYPCKMTDHLIVRNSIQINFLLDVNFDPEKYLQKQIQFKLNYSDECIEVLRCLSSKNSVIPNLWLTNYEKYDNLSFREIQILMWTSEFCQTFISKRPRFKKLRNPFITPDILKSILFFKFRLEQIKKLLLLEKRNEKQENSLFLLYDAMLRFQNGDHFKTYFGEDIINEMDHLKDKIKDVQLNDDIKCIWCEDKLTSEACASNHPDQRCCITGVQISGIAQIECEKCGMPADEDVAKFNEELVCPLCNVRMIEIT